MIESQTPTTDRTYRPRRWHGPFTHQREVARAVESIREKAEMVAHLEAELLDDITARAERTYQHLVPPNVAPAGLRDLLAEAHAEIPLDLRGLLQAGEMDFAHDIGGIVAYFCRVTRKFQQCFVPRYARPLPVTLND